MADELIDIINSKSQIEWKLNYNKRYVGLNDGISSRNFVLFGPRKNFLQCRAEVKDTEEWVTRLEDAGLQAEKKRGKRVWVKIIPTLWKKHREIITEFLETAVEEMEG